MGIKFHCWKIQLLFVQVSITITSSVIVNRHNCCFAPIGVRNTSQSKSSEVTTLYLNPDRMYKLSLIPQIWEMPLTTVWDTPVQMKHSRVVVIGSPRCGKHQKCLSSDMTIRINIRNEWVLLLSSEMTVVDFLLLQTPWYSKSSNVAAEYQNWRWIHQYG